MIFFASPLLSGGLFCQEQVITDVGLLYAGISNRFTQSLKKLNSKFISGIRHEEIRYGRSVINYEAIHYKAVMFALVLSTLPDIRDFLLHDFKITNFHEIKIVIGNPTNKKRDKNNYWGAPTIITNWIDRLRKYARVVEDNVNRLIFFFNPGEFIQEALRDFEYEFGLFYILDSLYVTHYLKSIQVSFKKKGITPPIEFDQLSEGEKQRLAIRGGMEIFRGQETLFLLDEPDAFSHPRWQWDFIPDLNKAIGDKTNSQVIFATHSPIIPTTVAANVFIMRDGEISPMNTTFGSTINESLAEQNIPYQETTIADQLKSYLALIQAGKAQTDEALQIRTDLENALGKEHSELQGADDLIALYE